MTRTQNPYIAGNPINDQDRFIGRADVMRETLRVLRHSNTNAIVLHGQRRIGKTSILLRLEKDLAGDELGEEQSSPVYFDLQDKAAMQLGDVLYQLAQSIAVVIAMTLPDHTQFDADGEFFRKQFLSDAAKHAAPRKLVLLFDEFDVLDSPQKGQAGSAFFPYLRTWMAQAQYVKFVFVLGRRPEELSTATLATFKGTRNRRVSLVNQNETIDIIRLSEKNNSLVWTKDAIHQVWQWTQGHPYFTQLLCSEIWEAAYDDNPAKLPTIALDNVEDVIDDAIEQGRNAIEWIWDGLPSAERIVMAAMAEEKTDIISRQQLMEILNRSGIRLILHELEFAPEALEKWDLLRKVTQADSDNIYYRFAIPLMKRWVCQNKPLRRVKAELDSIEPLAMSLYRSAWGFYEMGDLEGAEQLLKRALDVNHNHMQSRLLLGRLKLGQGNPAEAVATIETVYKFDPQMARQHYVAALIALAELEDDTDDQLNIYNRILLIEPTQPIAKDGVHRILTSRRKTILQQRVKVAEQHEELEQWELASNAYDTLLNDFPDEGNWQEKLDRAMEETELAQWYNQALGFIHEKRMQDAQSLLAKVIGRRPSYKESARYLLVALQGDDVTSLKTELESVKQELRAAQVQQTELESTTQELVVEKIENNTDKQLIRLDLQKTLPHQKNYLEWFGWGWVGILSVCIFVEGIKTNDVNTDENSPIYHDQLGAHVKSQVEEYINNIPTQNPVGVNLELEFPIIVDYKPNGKPYPTNRSHVGVPHDSKNKLVNFLLQYISMPITLLILLTLILLGKNMYWIYLIYVYSNQNNINFFSDLYWPVQFGSPSFSILVALVMIITLWKNR
ncbi:MAG: tetratricopeptide repeat protein, partial [Chloroflexota bacterium]